MRRRYRYNPATKEMEEMIDVHRTTGVLICPDITPFRSVVDGSAITGRRALREHNKRNGVTFAEDFRGDWDRAAKAREQMYSGNSKFDRDRRVERIKQSVEYHSRRK